MKFILVGKNSFLSQNLAKYLLNKKISFSRMSINNFLKLNNKKLVNYDAILNFSINKHFIEKKYNIKNDFDLKIAKKINSLKVKFVVFSTSKVYKPGKNLKENSLKKPLTIYGKNKLISEKKVKNIVSNYLILRVCNIIGKRSKSGKTNVTNTFFDIIRKNLKYNRIEIPKINFFKDFIFIDDFCFILHKLLIKDVRGIFNLSSGKKTYLHKLGNIISKITKKPIIYKDELTDSFTLNNSKLLKHANIKHKFKKLNSTNIKKYL